MDQSTECTEELERNQNVSLKMSHVPTLISTRRFFFCPAFSSTITYTWVTFQPLSTLERNSYFPGGRLRKQNFPPAEVRHAANLFCSGCSLLKAEDSSNKYSG